MIVALGKALTLNRVTGIAAAMRALFWICWLISALLPLHVSLMAPSILALVALAVNIALSLVASRARAAWGQYLRFVSDLSLAMVAYFLLGGYPEASCTLPAFVLVAIAGYAPMRVLIPTATLVNVLVTASMLSVPTSEVWGFTVFAVWIAGYGPSSVVALLNNLERHAQRELVRVSWLEEENQRLAAFPRENPNAVLAIDRGGEIVYRNPAAEALARDLGIDTSAIAAMLPLEWQVIVVRCLDSHEPRRNAESIVNGRLLEWSFHSVREVDIVYAYAQDITIHRQRQMALQASEERFRRIVETAGEGIWIVDAENRTSFVNARMAEMLGYAVCEMIGAPFEQFLDSSVSRQISQGFSRRLGEKAVRADVSFTRKDGSTLWAIVSASRFVDGNGDSDGFIAMITDITDRRQEELRLAHLATHDPLTDLGNRRVLEEVLARVVAKAHRGAVGSLLFLDLDHFKYVNDNFGHDVGDGVLKKVAAVLRGQLRESDFLARVGGDEFALVMEETNQPEAVAVGDRLRQAVEATDFRVGGITFGLGMSVGIVCIDGRCSPAELMSRADSAMYAAKEGGRNRVVVFSALEHGTAHGLLRGAWPAKCSQSTRQLMVIGGE